MTAARPDLMNVEDAVDGYAGSKYDEVCAAPATPPPGGYRLVTEADPPVGSKVLALYVCDGEISAAAVAERRDVDDWYEAWESIKTPRFWMPIPCAAPAAQQAPAQSEPCQHPRLLEMMPPKCADCGEVLAAPAAQQAPVLGAEDCTCYSGCDGSPGAHQHTDDPCPVHPTAPPAPLPVDPLREAARRVAVAVLSYFTVRPGGKCAACDSAPCASDCPVPMAREMAEGLGAWPIKPRSALSTAPLPVVQPAQQSDNLTTDATWSPLASVIARGIVASWEEHDDLWRVRCEVQGVGAVMQHLTPEDLRAIIEDCRRRLAPPTKEQP